MAGTTNMRKPPFASAETLFRFVFHRTFFPLSLSYFSHSQCWRGKSATIMARLNIAPLKHDELWAIQKVTHQIRQFFFTFFLHFLRTAFWEYLAYAQFFGSFADLHPNVTDPLYWVADNVLSKARSNLSWSNDGFATFCQAASPVGLLSYSLDCQISIWSQKNTQDKN